MPYDHILTHIHSAANEFAFSGERTRELNYQVTKHFANIYRRCWQKIQREISEFHIIKLEMREHDPGQFVPTFIRTASELRQRDKGKFTSKFETKEKFSTIPLSRKERLAVARGEITQAEAQANANARAKHEFEQSERETIKRQAKQGIFDL
jgi:nitrate/TMAO reductase-like tetraheme cytochrome c subunit